MATRVDAEFLNFEAKLSIDNPIEDYLKLMDSKMKADVIMPIDIYNECWRKISAVARETVWKILFNENKEPNVEQLNKASELLKVHKEDACFYQASEYNSWIISVRDELLKRKMFDFWKNEIVEKELGPCWARDSDLFDDPDDPEPANFYKYAGCEAAWLKKKAPLAVTNSSNLAATSLLPNETQKNEKCLKKISLESPLKDYKYNMETQGEISGDDDDAFKKIFCEARDVVWQLMFGEAILSPENRRKAVELLEEHKCDACFYDPWGYNEWIPKVKDEIMKRKYQDIWQDVVQNKLGLCSSKDTDYFEGTDVDLLGFYEVEDDGLWDKKNQ